MKKTIFIISTMVLAISLNANHLIQQLNVIAPFGLTMRMSPHINGEVIKVIPYGEEVVVTHIDSVSNTHTVDYVSGTWVMVSHDGDEGYVFDGFLTHLPIPIHDFETNDIDLALGYPLTTWAEYRLGKDRVVDTVMTKDGLHKTVHTFDNNQKLISSERPGYLHKELVLNGVRLMDAYHLVESMLIEPDHIKEFRDKTIYLTDTSGEANEVKVRIEHPVKIKKMGDATVHIEIMTFDRGC